MLRETEGDLDCSKGGNINPPFSIGMKWQERETGSPIDVLGLGGTREKGYRREWLEIAGKFPGAINRRPKTKDLMDISKGKKTGDA